MYFALDDAMKEFIPVFSAEFKYICKINSNTKQALTECDAFLNARSSSKQITT